jgi:hypothetical protein
VLEDPIKEWYNLREYCREEGTLLGSGKVERKRFGGVGITI